MSLPFEPLTVQVARVTQEAVEIRSYELVDPAGAQLPGFSSGAHLNVVLPSGQVRHYSLANDPAERHRYLIAVLREDGGRGGSQEMHDRVQSGDRLQISAPINNFPLSGEARRHLFIAGGIGITPILSMVRQTAREGADWRLHYCTRSPEHTAFAATLEEALYRPRVQLHHDGGDPVKGLDVAALLAEVRPATHVYCCGPAGLMAAVREAGAHWPQGSLHFEYFTLDETAGDGAENLPFEVEIASSGRVFQIPADKSILEVLEAHGLEVPSLCTEGLCGTCITGVLEGEPDHRDVILDDEEKATNTLMTICCSRAKGGRLKLDL